MVRGTTRSSRDVSVMPQIFTVCTAVRPAFSSLSSVWWYDPMNVHFLQWGLCMWRLWVCTQTYRVLHKMFFFFFFFFFALPVSDLQSIQRRLWYVLGKSAFPWKCYETVNYIWSCSSFSKLGLSWASRVTSVFISPQENQCHFLASKFKIKYLVECFCI